MSVLKITGNLTQVLAPTSFTTYACPVYARVPPGKTQIGLVGNGTIRVFTSKDNFTVTWTNTPTNPGNAFDENLDTYAYYWVGYSTPETEGGIIDYGSVEERYLFLRLSNYVGVGRFKIYDSSDGSTWNLIIDVNPGAGTSLVFKRTFRYVKINFYNPSSSLNETNLRINEVNAFKVSNAVFSKTITFDSGIIIEEISYPRYWLIVDPTTNISVSVFEDSAPASFSRIIIR